MWGHEPRLMEPSVGAGEAIKDPPGTPLGLQHSPEDLASGLLFTLALLPSQPQGSQCSRCPWDPV